MLSHTVTQQKDNNYEFHEEEKLQTDVDNEEHWWPRISLVCRHHHIRI